MKRYACYDDRYAVLLMDQFLKKINRFYSKYLYFKYSYFTKNHKLL